MSEKAEEKSASTPTPPSWAQKNSPDYDPPRILSAVDLGIRLVEVSPPLIGFWANFFAWLKWRKENKAPDPLDDCRNGKHLDVHWEFVRHTNLFKNGENPKIDLPHDRIHVYKGKCRICGEPLLKTISENASEVTPD